MTRWRGTVVAMVGLLAACAGGPSTSTGSNGTASTTAPGSRWIDHFADKLTRGPVVDGQQVWLDQAERTVYVEDCAIAKQVTSEGGP